MSDRPMSEDEEFEAFIAELKALGIPDEIRPEDVGVVLPTPAEMLARAKAAELAALAQNDAPQARTSGWRPRMLVLAAAAAVAVIAGVLVVGITGKEAALADTPPVLDFEFAKARDIAWAPGKPARAQLLKLAEVAGKQSAPTSRGTTQYVASENWNVELTDDRGHSSATLVPIRRESWLHPDGSFTVRESTGAPLRADGRHDLSAPPVRPKKSVIETNPARSLDAEAVERLGSGADQARQALLRSTDCSSKTPSPERAACLVGAIKVLAGHHVLAPEALRAFWLLLADEPSIRNLGLVRDRESRPGVGMTLIEPDTRRVREILIISPRTGDLLGVEEVLIKSDDSLDLHAPAIYRFSAIVESRTTSDPGPAPTSRR